MSQGLFSFERAQPWLGTFVSIRVDGLRESKAHEAIDRAFAEVRRIHRLMSYHDSASDTHRLNQTGHIRPVAVDPDTYRVLTIAAQVAETSGGTFDITAGRELVSLRALPRNCGTEPSPEATWRDVQLLPDRNVFFRRPLLIDLGGIAKGFAVDRALEQLQAMGVSSAVVNAGGDLRVCGSDPEEITLDVPDSAGGPRPIVQLSDGALASSQSATNSRLRQRTNGTIHLCGRKRTRASYARFVCVAASSCVVADALTKVVLFQGRQALNVLRHFHAAACFFDEPGNGVYLDGSNAQDLT